MRDAGDLFYWDMGDDYAGAAMAPAAEATEVPEIVAGRYRLGAYLGSGAFSVVYRAHDMLRDDEVALKLLDRSATSVLLRREVVALRGLRLPGIVTLRDEGIDQQLQDRLFLAMDLVEGTPFPGTLSQTTTATATPTLWNDLKPMAVQLLDIIGRIHATGMLHLDLKPANVLVDQRGAVVVLDLGLAAGPALGGAAPIRGCGGTRRYMAPEQLDGELTPACDLYAVAVMLWEVLTGALPPQITNISPRKQQLQAAGVPEPVAKLLCRALARDLSVRPASAWDMADALAGHQHESWQPPPSAVLHEYFCGPERLLHVPSRTADILQRRTQGKNVHDEIKRWLRIGLAVPDNIDNGRRLRVDLAAVQQFEWAECSVAIGDGSRARSYGDEDIAPILLGKAREHAMRGELGPARFLLSQGLQHQRHTQTVHRTATSGAERGHVEAAMLSLWSEIALEERSPQALELALYEVGRASSNVATSTRVGLECLLRGALCAERGELARAEETIAKLVPFGDDRLELWRFAVRQRLAARKGRKYERAVIEQAQAWAHRQGDADAKARVLDWMGRFCYQEGQFTRAAELQVEAVAYARAFTLKLGSQLNGASAWMEAGAYDMAQSMAEAARREACEHRLPIYEARAEWLLRALAYRQDSARAPALKPDLALIEAAKYLDVAYLYALIALNEAAVAWRLRQSALATELAQIAHRQFDVAGMNAGSKLSRALALTCGDGDSRAEEAVSLAREIEECPIPDIGWQIFAALMPLLASTEDGAHWQQVTQAHAAAAPRPTLRRELFAPNEVV